MNAVIIVAGGKGLRMGGDTPKQFLPIGGKPVLMHTIERFLLYDPTMQIVLVLPKEQHGFWKELCEKYQFSQIITIATGGDTRFHSVRNGLDSVSTEAELIGVHDGVRPFVNISVIANCYDVAKQSGAAMPVVDVVETMRHVEADGLSRTVPRGEYRLGQTPQVFRSALLREAYRQPYSPFFTDDATVVEALTGQAPTLVPGNRENIKITTPFDLAIAETLARQG